MGELNSIDPSKSAKGGFLMVTVVGGKILLPGETPDTADGVPVCLSEKTPSADKMVFIQANLAAYNDAYSGRVWNPAVGESTKINVVQGDYHSVATAMIVNPTFSGGVKDGTQTSAWNASSASAWMIDPQGIVGRTEYWAGLYPLMPQAKTLLARTDNWLSNNARVLPSAVPVEITTDTFNGRALLASVKIDRAGNILTDSNGAVVFAPGATSLNPVTGGNTSSTKPEGFNIDVRSFSGAEKLVLSFDHTAGPGGKIGSFGSNVIEVVAGNPYNFVAGVVDAFYQSNYYYDGTIYNRASTIGDTFLNAGAIAGSDKTRIWIGYKDQFGNFLSGSTNPNAKVRFRWERDDPTYSSSTDWYSNPNSTYNSARAQARRAAPNNSSSFATLPADFVPTGSTRTPYLVGWSGDNWGTSLGQGDNNAGWVLTTKRAHCLNRDNRNEGCYTDNIRISIENPGSGWADLPTTLENSSFTIPLRVYPNSRVQSLLCKTDLCRSVTTAAVVESGQIVTPAVYTSTEFVDQTQFANANQYIIQAVDMDIFGNSIGRHNGTFTVETLLDSPIQYDDPNSERAANADNTSGQVFGWKPFYAGKFRLRWTAWDSPSNPDATSGIQTVNAAAPARLKLSLFTPPPAGSTSPETRLFFKSPAMADVSYRPEVRLVDNWGNTVNFSGNASINWSYSAAGLVNQEGFEPLLPANAV
ncbi:hypothetical protein EBR21_10705, partial [bacterium]|nr:hypothetical protein [bacterium]